MIVNDGFRPTGGKEGCVDNVEIVEVVGAAVNVEHGLLRVGAEAAGAVLMADTFERYAFFEVGMHVDGGVGMACLLQHFDPACLETLERFHIVVGVVELDFAVDDLHAVIGVGQIFGGEPPGNSVR
jgi:hypothetical protein